MFAVIREPVPPARTRKPTLPKPVNSSSLVDEAMDEVDFVVDNLLEMDGAVNAYVDCNSSNS